MSATNPQPTSSVATMDYHLSSELHTESGGEGMYYSTRLRLKPTSLKSGGEGPLYSLVKGLVARLNSCKRAERLYKGRELNKNSSFPCPHDFLPDSASRHGTMLQGFLKYQMSTVVPHEPLIGYDVIL